MTIERAIERTITGWHWLIELDPDGMPMMRGPYRDGAHQTAVAREMMADGRRVMWLDTVRGCPPDVGTVTLDPLGTEDNCHRMRDPGPVACAGHPIMGFVGCTEPPTITMVPDHSGGLSNALTQLRAIEARLGRSMTLEELQAYLGKP